MHNGGDFLSITILRYSTHRVSHPRYRLFIVTGNIQPLNSACEDYLKNFNYVLYKSN